VLEKIPFVQDIRDDYVAGSPTVKVRVDRQKAALLGLSTDIIALPSRLPSTASKFPPFAKVIRTLTSLSSCPSRTAG